MGEDHFIASRGGVVVVRDHDQFDYWAVAMHLKHSCQYAK